MDSIYYFAYGSNMLNKVMSGRRGITYIDKRIASAKGWHLVFNCPGVNKYEPAFANIEQNPEGVVHGVGYRITEDEFSNLVKTEGGMYKIVELTAQSEGEKLQCRTLLSKDTVDNMRPSYRYLKLLIDGAKENKLDSDYIKLLLQTEHEPTPPGYEFVCKLVAVYLRMKFFLQKRK